jgi:hypothetical protein
MKIVSNQETKKADLCGLDLAKYESLLQACRNETHRAASRAADERLSELNRATEKRTIQNLRRITDALTDAIRELKDAD